MSVTFNLLFPHPTYGEVQGEVCNCGTMLDEHGHATVCADFENYRYCDHLEAMCEHNAFEVNVSNANARDLLSAMGFAGPDLMGSADADVFVKRAMRLANGRDMAVVAVETGGPGTGEARMIDCGRREGYANERGLDLMRLAQEAVARDLRIGWA